MMTTRMNMAQLGQMIRNPDLPFSLGAIEKAIISGANEFYADPERHILSFRKAFGAIRDIGQATDDGVVRAMEEAMGFASEQMTDAERERIRTEAIGPCARVAREQAERQMTVILFEKLRDIFEPSSEAPDSPGV